MKNQTVSVDLGAECFGTTNRTYKLLKISERRVYLQWRSFEDGAVPEHILPRYKAHNRHRRLCGLGIVEWSREGNHCRGR